MNKKRVVITGMGVVSPNAPDLDEFRTALREGKSGISKAPEYADLKFTCQVAGLPDFDREVLRGTYISEVAFHGLQGENIAYGIKAALDAWMDAGFDLQQEEPLWNAGCVFGNSIADSETIKGVIEKVDRKEGRKLGSRIVEQIMNSGVTSYIAGRLGLANRIITSSAACATGSQSVLLGYEYISSGIADLMVTGSCEHVDRYVFAAFDSMRVLSRKYNDEPERASRPMSATAGGFVPGSGAGALVLEELEHALARGARIYAEVLGGATNSGGQRNGGTMTAGNPEGVRRCITEALQSSGVQPEEVDLVSGHLTATHADRTELEHWSHALGRKGTDFPYLNSLKSMIGHCLSAAGSIELVAVALQLNENFVHRNLNFEDPHPDILATVDASRIPTVTLEKELNIAAKANFGFGDANSCLLIGKYKD